jgi:hypothetical protein
MTTRFLAAQPDPAAIEGILKTGSFETALCAELQFKTETLRFCDRVIGFIDNNGATWRGGRGWVSVSDVSGGTGNFGSYIEYGLGIPAEIWDSLDEPERAIIPSLVGDVSEYSGRKAILSLQIFGEGKPIGIPIILDVGTMNKPRLSVKPGNISMRINSENVFARKRIPPFGFLTQGDQEYRYPTDKGARFIPGTATKPVDWLNSN